MADDASTIMFPICWSPHINTAPSRFLQSPSVCGSSSVTRSFPASWCSKSSLMDGSWFEPRCSAMPNCSYLLMCLRNNILCLALSRCQAVWPGGDVLNGILIIEIFAAPVMPFCWLCSSRQMVSITHVQLESRKWREKSVRASIKIWFYWGRWVQTLRYREHISKLIVPANFTSLEFIIILAFHISNLVKPHQT